jgi:hypothetical protein
MKLRILAIALASVSLVGCSGSKFFSESNTGAPVSPGAQTAISEQRAVEDFKREGIKIFYTTFTRAVDAIEVTGYAPVWGGSASAVENAYVVAELDAKKKLNDFINKESVASVTSVNIITRNLEKAQDNKTNRIANNISTSDEEVAEGAAPGVNQATRQDALNIASTLNRNIRVSARGILGGLRLVDTQVLNGGRTVKVVYRWDKKHTNDIVNVRKMMMR